MSNPVLVILSVAVLFSVTLGLWSRTARVVGMHAVPMRYRRRVLWWQANAHHAQLVAVAVAAAALCAYAASPVAW